MTASTTVVLPLRGGGGEPVDFRRTLQSHGVAELPPMAIDPALDSFSCTLLLPGAGAQTIGVRQSGDQLLLDLPAALSEEAGSAATAQIRHILRLDADLSGFYELIMTDPDLAWAASGAGRMVRCGSVFEEVIKTICTTNCNWGATEKMVNALVENLGEAAPETGSGPGFHAFPTAAAMAEKDEAFYRQTIRTGYRSPHFVKLASAVTAGELDLEPLGNNAGLPDDQVRTQLLALPGVGPYAAAHIMTMLGRYADLILDSWTRPKYAAMIGEESVPDTAIIERFARYGPWAGLAFWLFITRDWLEE